MGNDTKEADFPMLFHVTLIHDAAHCPGYHQELMPLWLEGIEKKDEIAERPGVEKSPLVGLGILELTTSNV